MTTLANQTVLLVGGTSGLGFGAAKIAIESGASHVIVASSTRSKVDNAVARLQAIAAKTGGKVSGEIIDVTDEENVKAAMERIGEVDHLVYSCGDSPIFGVPFYNSNIESYKKGFEFRLWGSARVARYAKLTKSYRSSITFTSGAFSQKPIPAVHLAVSPLGAIETLARGLAVELAPIRVNVVVPAMVRTEMWGKFMEQEKIDEMYKAGADALLLKHVGTPEEIAEAYAFLMKCTFITGETIQVTGGNMLS